MASFFIGYLSNIFLEKLDISIVRHFFVFFDAISEEKLKLFVIVAQNKHAFSLIYYFSPYSNLFEDAPFYLSTFCFSLQPILILQIFHILLFPFILFKLSTLKENDSLHEVHVEICVPIFVKKLALRNLAVKNSWDILAQL